MRGLIDIAKDKTHKDHAKAIEMILNRTGFSEKQQIEVVYRVLPPEEMLERIRYLASKHNVNLSDDLTLPDSKLIEHKPGDDGAAEE
jgi:hypothetical protein